MQFSWAYILASKRNGTLYTGVTADLIGRVWQHRQDVFPGFARTYGCKRLVWFETHDDISEAIRKEKQLKRWRRAWKLELIEGGNPDWRDLWDELVACPQTGERENTGSRISAARFPG